MAGVVAVGATNRPECQDTKAKWTKRSTAYADPRANVKVTRETLALRRVNQASQR
ncbi:MAG: hypothetical protein BJ554DRAFT_5943 [Olpidium bornovanus]|uniref:Uncharacterized protein n=1 Tax=Olpidium bornovanus TaxID=278681 RepID=A0A8H7ZZF1_9FUNG|nr:MAG: hypothetical protein BJ554DRAFT_5943 [Olpidium bornovanus]